jgi:hypothetical protein
MLKKALAAALVIGSSAATAADFTTADELFAQREGSLENTQAAREAYLDLIETGLEGAELERAVVGALRSYIYEGEALTGTTSDEDVERRRELFKACWDETAPLMSPENLGYETPSYYYFAAVCMAYYGQVSGTVENLVNAPKMLKHIEDGLQTEGGQTYEGGGVLRVKAAVKSNPKAKPIPGGLYNPEAALELINQAIDAEAYPGSYAGFLYCENYRRKINVLSELDRNDEALAVADQTLADFELFLELGEIPEAIVPETKHCLDVVAELQAEIAE